VANEDTLSRMGISETHPAYAPFLESCIKIPIRFELQPPILAYQME